MPRRGNSLYCLSYAYERASRLCHYTKYYSLIDFWRWFDGLRAILSGEILLYYSTYRGQFRFRYTLLRCRRHIVFRCISFSFLICAALLLADERLGIIIIRAMQKPKLPAIPAASKYILDYRNALLFVFRCPLSPGLPAFSSPRKLPHITDDILGRYSIYRLHIEVWARFHFIFIYW